MLESSLLPLAVPELVSEPLPLPPLAFSVAPPSRPPQPKAERRNIVEAKSAVRFIELLPPAGKGVSRHPKAGSTRRTCRHRDAIAVRHCATRGGEIDAAQKRAR